MESIKGKAKDISENIKQKNESESQDQGHSQQKEEDTQHKAEEEAAVVVQRAWRHYSVRKNILSSDARWKDALHNAEKEAINEEADRGDKNDPRSRFRRGVFLAGRLEDGDALLTGTEEQNPKYTKTLETQHWLELVDSLDKGGGKDLSLPECSREQLESERIIFLSAEQRLNYLIKIDKDGKIRWDRNDEFVDTSPGKWKDAGDGKGIVPDDEKADEESGKPKTAKLAEVVSSVTRSESSSSNVANQAKHYEGGKQDQDLNALQRFWKERFTAKGLTQRVLRKTVRKNTWMYVSDKQYNVFIGIKATGSFQHSSFTSGGLVTSAGLIKVDNGRVTGLSPLSGHYRTSIEHYREFLKAMEERGMDLSHVHITKEESILWGLEHWAAFAKSAKESKKKAKNATWRVFHPKKAKEEGEKDKKEAQGEGTADHPTETQPEGMEDNMKHKNLTEKVGKVNEKHRKEDEEWHAGSQWRWEIITGRANQARKRGEEKWKAAMSAVTSGGDDNATHGKSTVESDSEVPGQSSSPPKRRTHEGTEEPENNHTSTTHKSDNENQPQTPEERPPAY
ncbi:hypothetical protein FRC17_002166, partial [Serendipita sp. 399]